MFSHVFIEKGVQSHPRVVEWLQHNTLPVFTCDNFQEIFNRKGQSFRKQKEAPVLIIAQKRGTILHAIPPAYGIGTPHNYYFSHFYNCPYDCRYCFLQGLFRSAHYVWFVNYEDYFTAFETLAHRAPVTLFSGYDADSLAMEPMTHFVRHLLPWAHNHPEILFELRSKSIGWGVLKRPPLPNVIAAFTLSPDCIAQRYEQKAPTLRARLRALVRVARWGWPIGLRFDPMLLLPNYQQVYSTFFDSVFECCQSSAIHSCTLGTFRLPRAMLQRMRDDAPDQSLYWVDMEPSDGLIGYAPARVEEALAWAQRYLEKYIAPERIFLCQ